MATSIHELVDHPQSQQYPLNCIDLYMKELHRLRARGWVWTFIGTQSSQHYYLAKEARSLSEGAALSVTPSVDLSSGSSVLGLGNRWSESKEHEFSPENARNGPRVWTGELCLLLLQGSCAGMTSRTGGGTCAVKCNIKRFGELRVCRSVGSVLDVCDCARPHLTQSLRWGTSLRPRPAAAFSALSAAQTWPPWRASWPGTARAPGPQGGKRSCRVLGSFAWRLL